MKTSRKFGKKHKSMIARESDLPAVGGQKNIISISDIDDIDDYFEKPSQIIFGKEDENASTYSDRSGRQIIKTILVP